MRSLPVVDVSSLVGGAGPPVGEVAAAIGAACRESGFFYVGGHGVPGELIARLDAASRAFFALPEEDKLEIAMARGGRAWRGFFPLGAELTSGRPDRKEGLYFGRELGPDDPRVRAGTPLHGANLFPRQVPQLRAAVLAYLDRLTATAQAVLSGVALSLGLAADHFATRYTADPTILFRIFHYPPAVPDPDDWGVGEHTDYGLITLLLQDANGGLQVRGPAWLDRRAAGAGDVRVQPRRHARGDDGRRVPLDRAPRAQHVGQRASLVPVLPRPRLDRDHPRRRHVRRLRGRQGVKGLP